MEIAELVVNGQRYAYYPVRSIEGADELPIPLKVLLENVLRNAATPEEALLQAQRIVSAGRAGKTGEEIEFGPARVLFQDFTGVPVFVDFAAMRDACADLGGNVQAINPQVQCDLIIDHSVIADCAGTVDALAENMKLEFQRNRERYTFLKWAQDSFDNVRIVPPGSGICHQLNIEALGSVVLKSADDVVYFDTVVGTDSHTPTINGIGVLGWGVGGIEAEAAALGQPITTLVPQVVGVHLTGALQPGVEAMDVALTFAQMLRAEGVVGCFVECFGEGLDALSATQRACIANMTPEYGATCTLFPVDTATLEFLRVSGRNEQQVALVEAYAKAQGAWRESGDAPTAVYANVLELDLATVKPSMAGPSRPHDRFDIAQGYGKFHAICEQRGLDMGKTATVRFDGESIELGQGAIAIAAITSCTTATDPHMMLACGLAARNAAAAGLAPKPWVKCVFAPGSHATQLLLARAGLLDSLQQLGFATCGFGCMSCIGNSGPVKPQMHEIAGEIELTSVLSGNRNFEGRISPDVAQNYLMTPAAVVAYSLAGTLDFDTESDPLGFDAQGAPVYWRDIWPTAEEIDALVATYVTSDLYTQGLEGMFDGDAAWQSCVSRPSDVFAWDDASTYVRKPPYFEGMTLAAPDPQPIQGARVLAKLGDFITTDHISPAGSIAAGSPAATYLEERGVQPQDFNTYGSRRGNHEVMMRGTFANVRLKNELAQGKAGGYTFDFAQDAVTFIYDAAVRYAQADTPCIVLAGKMYGSGSSRDWAAKGPMLLGVRAVIAESYERIHRSNLIGMGILPLQYCDGENAETLGLDGTELIDIAPIDFAAGMPDPRIVEVTAHRADGSQTVFNAVVRIDTPTEGRYYAHGGILPFVLRGLINHG